MTQKESAYGRARRLGERVFYEAETDTIRTQPENYLVAVHASGSGWRFDLDNSIRWLGKKDLNDVLTQTARLAEAHSH
jgi:hypothetical protein